MDGQSDNEQPAPRLRLQIGSRNFMFATGIENSYPTILLPNGQTKRVDEMEKTKHYTHWREDFELVKELGIDYLMRERRSGCLKSGPTCTV